MKEMYKLIEKVSGGKNMIYWMLTNELERDLLAVIKKHADMYHRNGYIDESQRDDLVDSCVEALDDYIAQI